MKFDDQIDVSSALLTVSFPAVLLLRFTSHVLGTFLLLDGCFFSVGYLRTEQLGNGAHHMCGPTGSILRL